MKDNLLPQLLSDLKERASLTPEHADHVLHMRAIAALECLRDLKNVCPRCNSEWTLENVPLRRPLLPPSPKRSDTPEFLREKAVALQGLGPEFRLRMGAKEVACPKCDQVAGATCFNGRVCDDRVYAFAAARRRHNAGDGQVIDVRRLLKSSATPSSEMLNLAINTGVVRLTRAVDGSPRWVDA